MTWIHVTAFWVAMLAIATVWAYYNSFIAFAFLAAMWLAFALIAAGFGAIFFTEWLAEL
jgi:hypothetical protein